MAGNPPVNHTWRSWTNNGVHYTMEAASYASPGISFGTMSGTTNSPFSGLFAPFQSAPRSQGSGVLGHAFGLIGDVLSAHQQQRAAQSDARRSMGRQPYVEDLAYGEDDYTGHDTAGANRPRSFISKFADRLLSNSQQTQQLAHNQRQSQMRRGSTRPNYDRRSSSYRTEVREPFWVGNYEDGIHDSTDSDDEEVDEEYEIRQGRRTQQTSNTDDATTVNALANAAEHHRCEAQSCRARLEQAFSHSGTSHEYLASLWTELKGHEKSYESASRNLKRAKAKMGRNSSQRQAPPPSRPSQSRRTTQNQHNNLIPPDDFGTFFQSRRATHPLFAGFDHDSQHFHSFAGTPFGAFQHVFNDFGMASPFEDHMQQFFTTSGASSGDGPRQHTRFPTSSGPQSQQTQDFTTYSAAPRTPPANHMRPEEARMLFKAYNERWNSLPTTDPSIPYPCRGLQMAGLSARDSIWANLINSPVSTWSEETVMQANTQAFFLGVVGITPQYTQAPGTGRVLMGFDKSRASVVQLKELVDILKKEKIRWHSDRLGRRNGGMTGPNEALQRDERARAVFHAVCELVEVAQ